jgi:hypothetical protein
MIQTAYKWYSNVYLPLLEETKEERLEREEKGNQDYKWFFNKLLPYGKN